LKHIGNALDVSKVPMIREGEANVLLRSITMVKERCGMHL
jgi:hypothetical protein